MLKTNVKELFFELMKNGVSTILGHVHEIHTSFESSASRMFWCTALDEELLFMLTYCDNTTSIMCSTAIEIDGFKYVFRISDDSIEFYTVNHTYIYRFTHKPQYDYPGFDMDNDTNYKLIQGFKTYIDGYFIK